MTNHVHLIATPDKADSLVRAIGEAHRRYTRMINFRDNVRGFLFQGRFSSCPVSTGDYLLAAVRYVERNPVRAGMVTLPWEYPWSSARFHLGITERDPLVKKSSLLKVSMPLWKKLRAEMCGRVNPAGPK
jgi:putative transposase